MANQFISEVAMNKQLRGNLMLLLTAMIWGSAFVAQSVGMDYVGPFTFNCVRCIIGGIVLIPVIILLTKIDKRNKSNTVDNDSDSDMSVSNQNQKKTLIIGSIVCGFVLFASSSLQQVGIQYTTAGKAGFITTLYIVFVPILGMFLGQRVKAKVWVCVSIAAVGLYLLCINEGFTIGKGDFLILLCAVAYAVHILVIDYFSPKVDGVKMSCLQFFICALLSIPPMVMFETPEIVSILQCWLPLFYSGVLSCGVAFTLQIIGQKYTQPTIASLLLSLESVFAVLAGMLVLHEMLTIREFLGCILMFTATIVAQMPSKADKMEKISA